MWRPTEMPASDVLDWVQAQVERGIYEPGKSDLWLIDRVRLTACLCHEADIHIRTEARVIVERCAERWLGKGYRVLRSTHKVPRSNEVQPSVTSWREIHTVAEAAAGL